jgi:hypothetical protein
MVHMQNPLCHLGGGGACQHADSGREVLHGEGALLVWLAPVFHVAAAHVANGVLRAHDFPLVSVPCLLPAQVMPLPMCCTCKLTTS